MIVSDYNQDILSTNICKDGNLGVIVFYSGIKNLKFEAKSSAGGNAIVSNEYDNYKNCYILCVEPQKSVNFSIKISAEGYTPESYKIGVLNAKEKKIYSIEPEKLTAEIKVLDKNGKPLNGARIIIKDKPDDEKRKGADGIYEMPLITSGETTLVVSFTRTSAGINIKKEIKVRPGSKETVILDIDPDNLPTPSNTASTPSNTVEIKTYNEYNLPLNRCNIYSGGKLIGTTNDNGYCIIKLSTSGETNFLVSHYKYKDRLVTIKPGDGVKEIHFKELKPTSSDNLFTYEQADYLALCINTGFPWTLGASLAGRHGISGDGIFGLGYYGTFGVDFGGTYINWSLGLKVFPYKNFFVSGGYGALGCKKMEAAYDINSGRWNTDGWRQGQGLIFSLGHDFLSNENIFFSPSIGCSYDLRAVEKNWQFLINIKLGLYIEI
jgi:hypothetical protein